MAKKKVKDNKVQVPTPKTEAQRLLINSIKAKPMVIASGPAGTGKSYLTASMAADYLKRNIVDKIVVTRPTVPTGRSIGFFPGTLEEKMEPWCKPILVTLENALGTGCFESQVRNGNIEIVPFETIRGRSFERCFIILDEAQNCTEEEVKAFTTRQGEDSTCVINGDISQSDIGGVHNGLSKLVSIVRHDKRLSKFVALVEFDTNDIVRSGMCQLWVEAFEGINRDNTTGLERVLGHTVTGTVYPLRN